MEKNHVFFYTIKNTAQNHDTFASKPQHLHNNWIVSYIVVICATIQTQDPWCIVQLPLICMHAYLPEVEHKVLFVCTSYEL